MRLAVHDVSYHSRVIQRFFILRMVCGAFEVTFVLPHCTTHSLFLSTVLLLEGQLPTAIFSFLGVWWARLLYPKSEFMPLSHRRCVAVVGSRLWVTVAVLLLSGAASVSPSMCCCCGDPSMVVDENNFTCSCWYLRQFLQNVKEFDLFEKYVNLEFKSYLKLRNLNHTFPCSSLPYFFRTNSVCESCPVNKLTFSKWCVTYVLVGINDLIISMYSLFTL